MYYKNFLLWVILSACAIGIVSVFWYQEIQYRLPAQKPADYAPVSPGTPIDIGVYSDGHITLLHFYNPSCPCSKFNTAHIRYLHEKYGSDVTFIGIAEKNIAQAESDLGFTVLEDKDGRLADQCGVYATPQAVILDANSRLYYRGNYNKARYCSLKESNYAEAALTQLLAGKINKRFPEAATNSYGCLLSSNNSN